MPGAHAIDPGSNKPKIAGSEGVVGIGWVRTASQQPSWEQNVSQVGDLAIMRRGFCAARATRLA